jgi:ADP-ribosylglycohydrolase
MEELTDGSGRELLEAAIHHCPEGATRVGLHKALSLPSSAVVPAAVAELGNGSRVTSPDTVPFALWCAARHLDSYHEALWQTVSGLGDRDTTCAIVGGIVALAVGGNAIPASWLAAREPLPAIG